MKVERRGLPRESKKLHSSKDTCSGHHVNSREGISQAERRKRGPEMRRRLGNCTRECKWSVGCSWEIGR